VAPGAGLQSRQLTDLPTNGRDFARFSLLTPGANPRSASMADLPFNGLTIFLNSYSMDGVDASRVDVPFLANGAERGARLFTGSLETIAEFRVQSSNYEAQYGRAASAYINIATKSGGNRLHADLFGYLRNSLFDARNFFNTKPNPQAKFQYGDFGANLSGPLRKNHTFFFANYEGARQRIGVTGTGTTLSPSLRGQVLAQSPALAPILAEFPAGTAKTADPLVDLYTTVSVSRVREDTGSFRLDHNFGDRNMLFVRANGNDSHVRGPLFAISPPALGLLDSQDVPVRTTNLAVHDQHLFGPHFLIELLAGMQRVASQYNAATGYPVVSVSTLSIAPGGGANQKNTGVSDQAGSDMSYTTGAHSWKWGASVYRIQHDVRTTDSSRITFTSLDDFAANSAATATYAPGIPGRSVRAWQLGLYVQDSWRVRRNLTVDVGLRYDYEPPIFDPAHLGQPFDRGTQSLDPPGAAYYEASTDNFGPRLAATWQPGARWTVRAGYGIYFEPYPVGYAALSIPQNSLPGSTTLLRQQIPGLGYPIAPLLPLGTVALPSAAGFDQSHRDTYAQQWNATVAWRLSEDMTLQTAYVANHALNLRRRYNINLFDPVLKRRPNPAFSDILIEATDAQSIYDGLQISLTERFHRGLVFALHYTWSHAIDDAGDENFSSSQPQDINNVGAERGNGSQDVRHAASFNAVYELPFGRGKRLLAGWQVAGLGLLRTGIPTSVTIPLSQTGNGATVNQRPDIVFGTSPYPSRQSVDGWLNPAAFTLPAVGSFGNSGRNTVFGPGLAQIDVSVVKNTRLSESSNLQFRAEGFNLFNHPNFAQPGAVFGSGSFGRILNTLGRTLGMGTARQIQLALRLQF
jgi:hypothetical protein